MLKVIGASMLTVATAAGLLTAAATAGEQPLRLAMHEMMQMKGGGQPSQMGPGSMGPGTGMGPGSMSPGAGMSGGMPGMGMGGTMPGMGMGGGMPGMAVGPGVVDMTARLEGRLAFLRAELRITEAQNPAWTTFADGFRSTRQHLLDARQQLNQPYAKPADRLEQYERHLAARLEALKSARASFIQLYASLDDAQKHTADELVIPFIATF
jgi:hypothetical protein